ncbi:hypothetical protein HY967_05230, partial [Candidatus Jorgensenbacteria bacterium]|nr:hypothetical protein [Candidatus Jorgensenbacteria bacterium]
MNNRRARHYFFVINLSVFFVVALIVPFAFVYGQTSTILSTVNGEGEAMVGALRDLIGQKNQELKRIQEEREGLEKNIESVGQLKGSLLKEIKTIDNNIIQLNLSIKSNKIAIEKLDLEVDSLKSDTVAIERNIKNKKETVVKLLVALQAKDRDNLLTFLFKNSKLAESIAEAQSIATLNNALV